MKSHYQAYHPYLSPFDLCQPKNIKTYSTPPHLYLGYQPPNLSQFTPEQALRAGTLWNRLYDPYYNPREQASRGNLISNPHHVQKLPQEFSVIPPAERKGDESAPRIRMPDQGRLPEKAYQMVHDEIARDGSAHLNLATFVTTWMDPSAERLYAETVNKNLIDMDEYPHTAAIEDRCVRILADLWHSPHPFHTMGVSTAGSSEACMLGGLALKRRWQNARKRQGKPFDRPNIVF